QFNKAYQTQLETQIFLGKILVMIGLVDEQVVANALAMKTRETLLDAFQWPEGTFDFDPTPPNVKLDGVEARMDLLDLHREAEFRETFWQAIRAVFPHGKLRLQADEQRLPEPPKPGSQDARLFAMIKEGETLDDMVLALHATDFFLYQRLYALYRQGVVKVAEEPPQSPPPSPPPSPGDFEFEEISFDDDEPKVTAAPDSEAGVADVFDLEEDSASVAPLDAGPASANDLAKRARACLEVGDAVRAEPLARKAVELTPSPEHEELLRRTEAALERQLKKELLEKRRVPALLVATATLKTMGLSAPERYLLSRIDGTRDVGSIVQVSPLQELEALKLFQRFVDEGVIRLS
ncbi:MAG TPA: DUF4388 domain-containing protein, partial [Myxococcaceae bacterium]|nr:DUF4388 domain-containing protein [Myxococcaceae bacterium]